MVSEFIFFIQEHLFKRIDHKGIFEQGGLLGDIDGLVEAMRQKIIQFPISRIVFCNAHKAWIHTISKINAKNGFDAIFWSLPYKIQTGRSIVDVRQHQLLDMVFLGQLQ